MAHLEAKSGEQIQEFLNNNGGVAVVDCYATWCGPCKAIAPYVNQKSQETGIPLVKVDVDQAGGVSSKYNIKAMPTFLVIKGNWDNVVAQKVGGGQANVNWVFQKAAENK